MAGRLSHDWLARAVSLVGTAAVRSFASIPQKELDLEKKPLPQMPGNPSEHFPAEQGSRQGRDG